MAKLKIDDATIQVIEKKNPKRPRSRAFEKFTVLMRYNGKKVKNFKSAEGRYPKLDIEQYWPTAELRWASKRGLVKLNFS